MNLKGIHLTVAGPRNISQSKRPADRRHHRSLDQNNPMPASEKEVKKVDKFGHAWDTADHHWRTP